jgi:3-deoxy-D-manno-octulosonic-acid transferase
VLRGFEHWLYRLTTELAGSRLVRSLRAKSERIGVEADRFNERLGYATQTRGSGRLILLGARDANSAMPLFSIIEHLNEHDLNLKFLITTRKIENVDHLIDHLPANTVHQFLPIDLGRPVQSFIDHWSPDIVVLSGGEFWPELITKLHNMCIPLIAINTRMSEKSYNRWRWLPGLAKSILRKLDLIFTQDQLVAQKLKRLGAQSGKIRVTGIMSNAKKALIYDESLYAELSSAIGSRSVWLAAATNRAEEDVVINAHKAAMRRNRGLLLILHTHEQSRGARISARHENQNLTFALQEKGEMPDDTSDVYISDDSEELATYMRLASITFCGGTLSNGETIDPFHPASMGSAILHGSFCGEHEESFNRYNEAGATRVVLNGGELAKTLSETIAPDITAKMAYAAWEISSEGGEVSGIIIVELLEKLAEGVSKNAAA